VTHLRKIMPTPENAKNRAAETLRGHVESAPRPWLLRGSGVRTRKGAGCAGEKGLALSRAFRRP
jgi:hypothetical protein